MRVVAGSVHCLACAAHAKNPKEPVILYGQSWGGAAALITAADLDSKGIRVDLLITFDAVGKHNDTGRDKLLVPGNVAVAINYYQTGATQLGNNRLVAASEFADTDIFNIDVGDVKHTDVGDMMGTAAASLIQSVALQGLVERLHEIGAWMFSDTFGTQIQVTRPGRP
ncbi:MAG: hypothetical protein QOF63_4312 [Thermoanaerobaculia bacterium]|jgi:pimeloyl-ACP methyl ester carboxylesterase|nr:hypothetical protein [Thermoanaerobaculia bacterium]MEA2414526.1 hypothetical protein [Thermoanaerobaculia bacterium]